MTERSMYGQAAEYYDLIYHWKDYAAEAEKLHALLGAEGVPDGGRVLEAACGTGSYLTQFKQWYRVEGLDCNEGVLSVARTKVPGVPLLCADMAEFSVAEPLDAIVCLFSSIGYVYPLERLRAAAACFAMALRAGGVLVIEPWLTSDVYKPGRPSIDTYTSPDLKLCRMIVSAQEGEMAVLRFHWMVARKGAADVEAFVDEHALWLCPTETLLAAHRDAGFDCRFVTDGLMKDRGLLVARRR